MSRKNNKGEKKEIHNSELRNERRRFNPGLLVVLRFPYNVP